MPNGGGFALEEVEERARWLTEAAGDRDGDIERSILVQVTSIGDDAAEGLDAMAQRFEMPVDLLAATPFVLVGSVDQVVDKLCRLRERIGVSHVTVPRRRGRRPGRGRARRALNLRLRLPLGRI